MLSLLLESSTKAVIHDTLDYFLRLLYEVLEMVMQSSCTLQPLTGWPKLNNNEKLIKRQAYNE